jgi:TorA maturation chaperone TorD
MLECFSLFYLKPTRERWRQLERNDIWEPFITTARNLYESLLTLRAQNLSARGLDAHKIKRLLAGANLNAAPSFEEQLRFSQSHFVGGLPQSILPVESLYRHWTHQDSCSVSFGQQAGLYASDSAAHMTHLMEQFELVSLVDPPLLPDHLALELNLLNLIVHQGVPGDAARFIDDHLSWLPSYLDSLLDKLPETHSLIAVTALLIVYLEAQQLESQLGARIAATAGTCSWNSTV